MSTLIISCAGNQRHYQYDEYHLGRFSSVQNEVEPFRAELFVKLTVQVFDVPKGQKVIDHIDLRRYLNCEMVTIIDQPAIAHHATSYYDARSQDKSLLERYLQDSSLIRFPPKISYWTCSGHIITGYAEKPVITDTISSEMIPQDNAVDRSIAGHYWVVAKRCVLPYDNYNKGNLLVRYTNDYVIYHDDAETPVYWKHVLPDICYTNSTRTVFNDIAEIPPELYPEIVRSYKSTFTIGIAMMTSSETKKLYHLLAMVAGNFKVQYSSNVVEISCDLLPEALRPYIDTAEIPGSYDEPLILPNLKTLKINADNISRVILCEYTECVHLDSIIFYGNEKDLKIKLRLAKPAQVVTKGWTLSIEDLEINNSCELLNFDYNDDFEIVPRYCSTTSNSYLNISRYTTQQRAREAQEKYDRYREYRDSVIGIKSARKT